MPELALIPGFMDKVIKAKKEGKEWLYIQSREFTEAFQLVLQELMSDEDKRKEMKEMTKMVGKLKRVRELSRALKLADNHTNRIIQVVFEPTDLVSNILGNIANEMN